MIVTHLAVTLRYSKDILSCNAKSQPAWPDIHLTEKRGGIVFVQIGRYCKLKVTTVNKCKYRINKGLSYPLKDGWLFVYYGL